MLLGTPDANLISKPAKKNNFIEDLAPEQQVQQFAQLPVGFKNMGNTCYLNATLQALYRVNDLRDMILNYNPSQGVSNSGAQDEEIHKQIVIEMKRCFENLQNKSFKSVLPSRRSTGSRSYRPFTPLSSIRECSGCDCRLRWRAEIEDFGFGQIP